MVIPEYQCSQNGFFFSVFNWAQRTVTLPLALVNANIFYHALRNTKKNIFDVMQYLNRPLHAPTRCLVELIINTIFKKRVSSHHYKKPIILAILYLINKDFLKQVHRKMNAENCIRFYHFLWSFSTINMQITYTKTILKLNKML